MKLYLQGHDYRFAVEQAVMALLPEESIQTQEGEFVPEIPYLRSTLEGTTARCELAISQEQSCSIQVEALENTVPDLQFAIKDAIFQAVVSLTGHTPPWGSLTGVRPGKLASKIASQGKSVKQVFHEKYHVDSVRSALAEDCEKISRHLAETTQGISLYIGIPFCPSRCHYCSFYSTAIDNNESLLAKYVEALGQEIRAVAESDLADQITSVYIGGGTPTVVSPTQLDFLLSALTPFTKEEFTVEAGRPETITAEKIAVMEAHGVGRISINPQIMDDGQLQALGRKHSVEEIYQVYDLAKGKFQINMDLIAGLSPDTQVFLDSLDKVIALSPEQITVHSLTPKKNTALAQYRSESPWKDSLNEGWKRLAQEGYGAYYIYRQKKITDGLENVGWAKIGEDGKTGYCRYNVAMMEEFQSILGLGSGAMTKIILPNDILRHQNPKFPQEYMDKLPEQIEKKRNLFPKC